MHYNIAKLMDADPALCEKLRRYCHTVVGCCQQVHREMGPFLNEYMYQDALDILFEEQGVEPKIREYYFGVDFHGRRIQHKHYVDFFVLGQVFVECKAVSALGPDQRQQLWNYMRLTGVKIGILYNFAPVSDQCERYYLSVKDQMMYAF